MNKTLRTILLIIFILIFIIAAFMLVRELTQRRASTQYIEEVQAAYKPDVPDTSDSQTNPPETDDEQEPEVSNSSDDDDAQNEINLKEPNPSIQQLTSDYPDAIGWLTVDGADVSLPFAEGATNDTYLHASLDGSYNVGGTLFADYRCSRDLQDSVTIIYGHNMKNDSMFGMLDTYLNDGHIDAYPDVYVSLPDETLHYTVWACLVVDGVSDRLYSSVGNRDNIQSLVDSIASRASQLNRSLEVNGDDRLLVLSTCNYSFSYARTVLICVADNP